MTGPTKPEKQSPEETGLEKPRILVVEDDPAVALTITTLLEAEGYPVEHSPTSAGALELLAERDFPIVISDIYLDERTGLDILRDSHRAVQPFEWNSAMDAIRFRASGLLSAPVTYAYSVGLFICNRF